jgi:multidrug resistance efflux pump
MLELILCSLFTLVPDYLYRRYVQGKRIGKEITLYSVWFELRWGIVSCLMLTIALITTVFYFHPSTTNVTSLFRTVPIVPETIGRVAEIHIDGISNEVKKGAPIFTLDDSKQRAAVETAKRRVAEVDASMVLAKADIAAAEGQLQQARSAYQQALDELQTKQELNRRNADIVARREIERLQVVVDQRQGGIDAAAAAKEAAEVKLSTALPAEKASAEAALAQAQVDLDKTVVRAGIDGRVEQFALQVGDLVNPMMRSAGVLIPEGSGQGQLIAGFGQIEGQVIRRGMIAEAACISKPWVVIPMVVTQVQGYIAAGQFRGGEQLVDVQQTAKPGTILAVLEPLFDGGLDGVTPGSSCVANAYTSNHERLVSDKSLSTLQRTGLHAVDAVGLVHALILRIQTLLLPIQTLVFSGGH